MKNIISKMIFVASALFGLTVNSATNDNDPVFQIRPQFFRAYSFSEGLAAVALHSGKCGFIDKTGNYSISPIFDSCDSFSDGLAAVRVGDYKEGKWGYINKEGRFVIPPQFEENDLAAGRPVARFKEGLAAVRTSYEKTSRWGYINRKGVFAINPQFSYVGEFQDGIAVVVIGKGGGELWGYIKKDGTFLTNRIYESANNFSEGVASVNLGTKEKPNWVFIDKAGEKSIQIAASHAEEWRWGNAGIFKEGFAKVRFDSLKNPNRWVWKMIDRSGNIVFDDLDIDSVFTEGLAIARKGVFPNALYGYFDKSGSMVIPAQFRAASNFKNGYAYVGVNDNGTIKQGFIDKTGAFVVNPIFPSDGILSVLGFTEGLAAVRVGPEYSGDWGYIKAPSK